jgi:transposase
MLLSAEDRSPVLSRRTVVQFGKFLTVGTLNTAIDFGTLNLLSWMTGIYGGLLSAYGIGLPQGMARFRPSVGRQMEDEPAQLTPLRTEVFWQLAEAFLTLEQRGAHDHEKRHAMARAHPVCQRVHAMPGVGPLTATAILAAVPDATHVNNGRQLAAWLGLVPHERSTGGKPRPLGMSQRGDVYLHTLNSSGRHERRSGG